MRIRYTLKRRDAVNRVVDDSCGMSARDVANALERHYSKLKGRNLYEVKTIGSAVRLPSIAMSAFQPAFPPRKRSFGTK